MDRIWYYVKVILIQSYYQINCKARFVHTLNNKTCSCIWRIKNHCPLPCQPVIREHPSEDGGDATAQHVVDWGAVPEEGRGRVVSVSSDPHVHLRVRLLPAQEQPVDHLWGECKSTHSLAAVFCVKLRGVDGVVVSMLTVGIQYLIMADMVYLVLKTWLSTLGTVYPSWIGESC